MNNYEIEERIRRCKEKKAKYEEIRDSDYTPVVVLGIIVIVGMIALVVILLKSSSYAIVYLSFIVPFFIAIIVVFIVRVSLHNKRKVDAPFEIKNCEREIEALQFELQKNNAEKDYLVNKSNVNANNDYDILLKLKELLDAGIITQEEFDKKKKEIIG